MHIKKTKKMKTLCYNVTVLKTVYYVFRDLSLLIFVDQYLNRLEVRFDYFHFSKRIVKF